jgi:hypothetical protein
VTSASLETFAILITSQSGGGSKTDGTTATYDPLFCLKIATFAAELCILTAVWIVREKVADIVLGSMQLVV